LIILGVVMAEAVVDKETLPVWAQLDNVSHGRIYDRSKQGDGNQRHMFYSGIPFWMYIFPSTWFPHMFVGNTDENLNFLERWRIRTKRRKATYLPGCGKPYDRLGYTDESCELLLDEAIVHAKLRDHMGSYPLQYNPPVGKYWKQVNDLTNETRRHFHKWRDCMFWNAFSTKKHGHFVNVDYDFILAEYASYGEEVKEWRENGELDAAKTYLGMKKIRYGDTEGEWKQVGTDGSIHDWVQGRSIFG